MHKVLQKEANYEWKKLKSSWHIEVFIFFWTFRYVFDRIFMISPNIVH
jgi:hypothetical protein